MTVDSQQCRLVTSPLPAFFPASPHFRDPGLSVGCSVSVLNASPWFYSVFLAFVSSGQPIPDSSPNSPKTRSRHSNLAPSTSLSSRMSVSGRRRPDCTRTVVVTWWNTPQVTYVAENGWSIVLQVCPADEGQPRLIPSLTLK